MQGRKEIQPKMMYQVHLNDLVAADNFYRKINATLDFNFLYGATSKYYGQEGQENIDPFVFFKICLVGYLNNINSDRRLIEYCSNYLDIGLYLKYDLDEQLPWHSTISRGSTVEPVLGTMLNFLNPKRVNTRGIKQANKHVMMAALTYNLKKLL